MHQAAKASKRFSLSNQSPSPQGKEYSLQHISRRPKKNPWSRLLCFNLNKKNMCLCISNKSHTLQYVKYYTDKEPCKTFFPWPASIRIVEDYVNHYINRSDTYRLKQSTFSSILKVYIRTFR
jgi:hypothetical protein